MLKAKSKMKKLLTFVVLNKFSLRRAYSLMNYYSGSNFFKIAEAVCEILKVVLVEQ